MRIAIVSDIHANVVALEYVLDAIGDFDQLWNLGDTIGYGPRPNESMALMRRYATHMIAGNHDLACLGKVPLDDFNTDARRANTWNGAQLFAEHRAYFEQLLPATAVDDRFYLAHGSPRDPVWEYLLSREQAEANFLCFEQQVCLVGHSHVPLIIMMRPDGTVEELLLARDGVEVELKPGWRYIFNPGSVGQPRDRDPRAAYLMIDTDLQKARFHRVEYDIEETQHQMRQARLPQHLVYRLEIGT
jgi:diadenosine tetraphosphatase ApaH/serine/threonine PP2A family protein phosphatase